VSAEPHPFPGSFFPARQPHRNRLLPRASSPSSSSLAAPHVGSSFAYSIDTIFTVSLSFSSAAPQTVHSRRLLAPPLLSSAILALLADVTPLLPLLLDIARDRARPLSRSYCSVVCEPCHENTPSCLLLGVSPASIGAAVTAVVSCATYHNLSTRLPHWNCINCTYMRLRLLLTSVLASIDLITNRVLELICQHGFDNIISAQWALRQERDAHFDGWIGAFTTLPAVLPWPISALAGARSLLSPRGGDGDGAVVVR
jgi:hypothetical protein